MKSYWGVLLFGFVTFTSCNPTQLIRQEARINLDEGNLSKINGRYDNNSSDTIRWRKTVFWSHLKPFLEDYYNEHDVIPNSSIELKILEKDRIQISLLDQDSLLAVKTFKFQFKDGVLLIKSRNNRRLEGVPLIFFRLQSETLNLGLDKAGDLILSYDGSIGGGPLIIIFASPIIGTHTFLRKVGAKLET